MSVFVKICGLTNQADALAAVTAGADALGFMLYEDSSRHVSPGRVREIVEALPAEVAKVGVFVNAHPDAVRAAVTMCGLDTLQFHGEESPEYCRQFAPLKVWKAMPVKDTTSLFRLPSFETTAWLLDASVPGRRGGTGVTFNWDLAAKARELGRPIVLAGGLTPENVAEAVRHVQPWGVDVSSGVESWPGKKDASKVRAFIAAARGAARGSSR